MIRSIVLCAALALVLAATNGVGRSQSQEGGPNYGARRFEPLYETGRLPPPTDENGWPADWDEQPHLSLDVFGVTREFTATREYRNRSAYGDRPYGRDGYGNGPNAPYGSGRGPYGRRGFSGRESNRDLFSSDSGFALRYGNPGHGFAYGQYPPPFGYPGPAYGLYPPSFGYGAYGGYPPYPGYGLPYGGNGLMVQPPGGYLPYFGW